MSIPLGSVHTISVSAHCLYQLVSGCFVRLRAYTHPVVSDIHRRVRFSFRAACAGHRLRTGRRCALRRSVGVSAHGESTDGARDSGATYSQELTGAKASTAVIPVVVLELVDLDALAIIERRSGKCHHQLDAAHCLTPQPWGLVGCVSRDVSRSSAPCAVSCRETRRVVYCVDGAAFPRIAMMRLMMEMMVIMRGG